MEFSNDKHVLDLGFRGGSTDYIDFIQYKEVIQPVMRGTDMFKRSFIVVKMIIDNQEIMQTFFQRYTEGQIWMGCGHATLNLIETSCGMSKTQLTLIEDIINNKEVIITDDHRPYINRFIGKKVRLNKCNQEMLDAVKTIQKYWKICRYNPKYELCRKIQIKNDKKINYQETILE